MRRWLAIFLLVLLPAHFSWAKLAVYCAHESAPAAWHLGHHEQAHGHGAHDAAEAQADDGQGTTADLDCGHCHAQAAVMFTAFPGAVAGPAGGDFRPDPAPRRLAPAPHPPERPQWRGLA